MDEKDILILEALRRNSRESIRQIAKKTKIRPSTVHQRIQHLVKDKTIEKFTVKLNNKSIGENFIAFILIATKSDLQKEFFDKNQIKEVFGITGEYDLLIKMKFKDVDAFNIFLLSLRKEANITKTLTMIVTANLKEEI